MPSPARPIAPATSCRAFDRQETQRREFHVAGPHATIPFGEGVCHADETAAEVEAELSIVFGHMTAEQAGLCGFSRSGARLDRRWPIRAKIATDVVTRKR